MTPRPRALVAALFVTPIALGALVATVIAHADPKPPAANAGPSRLFDRARPQAPLTGAPTAANGLRPARGAAALSGTYRPRELPTKAACRDRPVFDLAGPDDQTAWVRVAPPSGFACPSSCTNKSSVVASEGRLSFDLVWVDDAPARDPRGGYTVTMHRTHHDLVLATRGDLPVENDDPSLPYLGAHKELFARPPLIWTDAERTRHFSSEVQIRTRIGDTPDPSVGKGAVDALAVGVGRGGEFAFAPGSAGCRGEYFRTDYRFAPRRTGGDAEGADFSCQRECRQQESACIRACARDQDCKLKCMSDGRACGNGC